MPFQVNSNFWDTCHTNLTCDILPQPFTPSLHSYYTITIFYDRYLHRYYTKNMLVLIGFSKNWNDKRRSPSFSFVQHPTPQECTSTSYHCSVPLVKPHFCVLLTTTRWSSSCSSRMLVLNHESISLVVGGSRGRGKRKATLEVEDQNARNEKRAKQVSQSLIEVS